jgi:outer membrane immunogenic protein
MVDKEIEMKRLLLAALLAGVASAAVAADLPYRKAAPAPAPAYIPPVFSWTGFYAGLNGGWGAATGGGGDFGSASGGLVGGTLGYNYQIGQFVIGAESDLDWADLNKSGWNGLKGNAYDTRVDTLFTARARAGMTWDRALLYVTGGYAGADVKLSQATYGSSTDWRSGGVIGAGVEYAFTNHISAKLEYLYAPLADRDFAGGKDKLDLSLVRAGLNYKF